MRVLEGPVEARLEQQVAAGFGELLERGLDPELAFQLLITAGGGSSTWSLLEKWCERLDAWAKRKGGPRLSLANQVPALVTHLKEHERSMTDGARSIATLLAYCGRTQREAAQVLRELDGQGGPEGAASKALAESLRRRGRPKA